MSETFKELMKNSKPVQLWHPKSCSLDRVEYPFSDDPKKGNDKFIFILATRIGQSDDWKVSLKFRKEEGIHRFNIPNFVKNIISEFYAQFRWVKSNLDMSFDERQRFNYNVEQETPRQGMRTLSVFPVKEYPPFLEVLALAYAYLETCKKMKIEPFA
jgi:hypothetical protein